MTFTFLLGPTGESATSQELVTEQSHGKEPLLRSDAQRAREYELMTIFAPDVPEEELQGAVDHVSAIVTESGGNVTLINRESPWGRRRLAYPIRHNSRDVRDGIYVLYYFESDPAKIVDIERDLRLTNVVIRYMVTQQVAAPMAPPAPEGEAPADAEAPAEPSAPSAGSEAPAESSAPAESDAPAHSATLESEAPAETESSAETTGSEPENAEPQTETSPDSTDETGEDSGTQG